MYNIYLLSNQCTRTMKPFWGTQGLKSGTDIKGGQCRLGVQCVPVGCLACPVEWTSVVLLPSLYSPFSISRFWSCGSGVTGPTPNYRGGSGSQGQDGLGARARMHWEMGALLAVMKLEECQPGCAGGYRTATQTTPPKKPTQLCQEKEGLRRWRHHWSVWI